MAAMPPREWTRHLGALLAKRITASWSRSRMIQPNTSMVRATRAPNAGSPRIAVAPKSDWHKRAAVLGAVKDKPAAALKNAVPDRPYARRPSQHAVGTEECARRGSNQRMDQKR